jgi:hypothetical protein
LAVGSNHPWISRSSSLSTTPTRCFSQIHDHHYHNQDVEEEQQQDESSIDDDIEVPDPELDAQEKVWRFAKKPLLRIGAKGATHAHGNSLRQLLEDHTVVKVKVNTKKFGAYYNTIQYNTDTRISRIEGVARSPEELLSTNSILRFLFLTGTVAKASETLRELAIENGAPADIEMIQVREGQKEILFGMPGTVKRVEDGSFPPPPPPPEEEKEEDEEEEGKLSE